MKKIISNISFLGKMNNAEHDYFHRSCCEILAAQAGSITLIAPVVERYRNMYEQEDVAFKLSQRMEETKQLTELDELRDHDFADLKASIEFYLRSRVAEVKEAAEKINFVFDRYKDADKRAYAENTDLIINMLQDLRKEPYPQVVATLKLEEVLRSLENNNNAFDTVYKERALHQREYNETVKLADIRRQVDLQFAELVDQVNAIYMTVKLAGTDTAAIQTLESIITDIMALMDHAERVYYLRINRSRPQRKPDPVGPGPVDPPGPVVPTLQVAEQIVEQSGQMKLRMEDPQAFTDALWVRAIEGELQLALDENWTDMLRFPFYDYIWINNDKDAIGLVVDNSLVGKDFAVPFASAGEAVDARYVRDGEVLVYFTGVFIPVME